MRNKEFTSRQQSTMLNDMAITDDLGTRLAAAPHRTFIGERNTLRVLSLISLIVIWELIGMHVKPLFLPEPWQVAKAIGSLTKSGGLIQATLISLKLFAFGFILGDIIAIPVGVLLGSSDRAFHFFESYITIFWATPVIALLPLFVIWFGLTFKTQLLIVLLSTIFPIILDTEVGVRNVEATLLEVADAFGATRWERFRYFIWPSAVPYVATGLRVGVGRAILGVVVAELFTSASGLGGKMTYYGDYFETADYFAALFMFVIFSLIMTELVSLLERRYNRWRE